jgi:hypothetical protein
MIKDQLLLAIKNPAEEQKAMDVLFEFLGMFMSESAVNADLYHEDSQLEVLSDHLHPDLFKQYLQTLWMASIQVYLSITQLV